MEQQLVIKLSVGLVALVLVAIDAQPSPPVANAQEHQRHKLLSTESSSSSNFTGSAAAATVSSSASTNRSVGKYSSAFRSAHKEEEEEQPADDTGPTNPEQLKCGSWGIQEKCLYESFPCCSQLGYCGSDRLYCGSGYCRPEYSIHCDA